MNMVSQNVSKSDIKKFTGVAPLNKEADIKGIMMELLDNGTELKAKDGLYARSAKFPVSSSSQAVQVLKNNGCIYTDQGVFFYNKVDPTRNNQLLKKEGLYFSKTLIGVVSSSDFEKAELVIPGDNNRCSC